MAAREEGEMIGIDETTRKELLIVQAWSFQLESLSRG